jgi:SSS family solute:Na+ symporter
MNGLDWGVMAFYMAGMVFMSWWLGRKQKDMQSYYLGGNNLSWWSIGISTMATQCSTNSLLGAPAFIITAGLLWLQYEFAVPLAMVIIMIFLLPFYRGLNLVSIYEYLERRFGVGTRTTLSLMFQFLRAFATGVTVYGISIVLQEIVGIPFWASVLVLGVVTIVYDMLGGMEAVVYSDVIQMGVLYLGILLCVIYSLDAVGGIDQALELFPQVGDLLAERTGEEIEFSGFAAVDFSGHGFGDGKTFAFWPMLLGGLFLYVSYYGCDQTQVQRELSSKDLDETNMSLMLNGVMRFPLVLTYCLMGVCIGAFLVKEPQFLETLKSTDAVTGEVSWNYNLAVPRFVLSELPHGVIGLVIVALFSAAMSSLDSTINSLSATSMKDLYERFVVGPDQEMSPATQLKMSRIFTVFWGVVCVAFSFVVGDISKSVIESVNKIGSLANGPILALFLLGILTRRANATGAVVGLLGGFCANVGLWLFAPGVSWLWWNVIGFVVSFAIGYGVSLMGRAPRKTLEGLVYDAQEDRSGLYRINWTPRYLLMAGYTVLMIGFCVGLGSWLSAPA